MLTRILIQNFALIDSMDICIKPGMQVITGETGAGKSIILGALRLILGERADPKSSADNQKKTVIEAEFLVDTSHKVFFEEHDLDFEPHTLIRREISITGKSRAFINDIPVTLPVLKQFTQNLIDIHSQFETSKIFTPDFQFSILDGMANNQTLLSTYQLKFQAYLSLNKALTKLKKQLYELNKNADYHHFILQELVEADLDSLNLEDLQIQLDTLENAEAIRDYLREIFLRIDQDEVGILESWNEVRTKLNKVAALSHQFLPFDKRLDSLFIEFKDLVFELQNSSENIEVEPVLLLDLQKKVNKIHTLLHKHQVEKVEDLITIRNQLSAEDNNAELLEDKIKDIEKTLISNKKELEDLALELHKNRKKTIPIFSKKMENLLHQLGLEKAKIEVKLSPLENLSEHGLEDISLYFQANTGFEMQPIQSAISGGERSRVMFAIKKIMAENNALPTLILDEIDTGISGKIANEMGNMMKEMGENLQLLVITHLPQIAAKGNDNYKVTKSEVNGKTKTIIEKLTDDEKLVEIAQLISGSTVTEAAKLQALELIKT